MIGVFTDPYPDELFYSICARTCKHAGYSSHRSALRDLFGSESVIASVTLPSHLNNLVARLPPESAYTSDYFIAEHTLLPFYNPFLPSERLSRIRQAMCGQKGSAIHMLSGIMASHIPLPEWLRFCPQCVAEDKSRYGECYWHRTHQVPGVELCPSHEVYLQDSDARARNKKTRHEFVAAVDAIRWSERQPQTQSPYHQILLALARDANFLLRQCHLFQESPLLYHRYRKLLFKTDLATYGGRVDRSLFLQQFRNCYHPQLLQLLHCELEEQVQETWLLRLIYATKSAQHPLHHLLLIHFLGYTAEDFFGIPVEDQPFGDGPWPCLNPICSHYHQLGIRECQVVHSQYVGGKPIGTFVCACGFAYSRTGPDATGNKQFQLNKIKAFGTLWETRLQMLWKDETASLRAIARQLGVDPLTVKRQAARIGLPFPRPVRRCLPLKSAQKTSSSLSQVSETAILEKNRTMWLALMQAHPEAGVKMLRSKEPNPYTWLYRNDRAWLQEHKPLLRKPKQPFSRVDWETRDLQIAEEARAVALRLKNSPERPVRITISSIGREIGQLALLQQHLDRLPKTAEALGELVETREAFAVRRVWWATLAFRQEHIYPERWQLVKRAGVSRLAQLPEIKNALNRALQRVTKGREHESTAYDALEKGGFTRGAREDLMEEAKA